MQKLSAELEKRLGSAVESMPAFPKSVQRVLELTRDINCRPKDLIEVIEKDPVITIKVLKVVNSAYYSLPNKITSINQAVVYLGVNTLKNLALSFSTIGILPRQNGAGFDIQHYLVSSLVTANVTRSLCAKFAMDVDQNDAYITGLLLDFGKVVFAQFMPDEFSRALNLSEEYNMPLHKAEEAVIGTDHCLVGARLAKRWQFPNSLVNCIAGHHGPEYATPLAQCLHVADLVAERLGYDSKGKISAAGGVEALHVRFGGNLDSVISALGDTSIMIEEALQFSQAGA